MRKSKRVRGFNRMSKKGRDQIVFDFIYSLAGCKNINDAAIFIEDLLTETELEFISRRLRIAKFLIEGKTYAEIRDSVQVSDVTIAKIAAWLKEKGDGFRSIVRKLPERTVPDDPMKESSWVYLQRKYPVYFLPEKIIEQIVSMANKKQKVRLMKVIQEVDESLKKKSQLHRNIELLLSNKIKT